jgi:hypothetical protein
MHEGRKEDARMYEKVAWWQVMVDGRVEASIFPLRDEFRRLTDDASEPPLGTLV